MSLPVLHSVVGITITVFFYPRNSITKDWRYMLLSCLVAVSPDLDYLPVYGFGMSYECHRSFTHSIFFALMATLLILIITRFSYIKRTLACGTVLLSHGLVDFLVSYNKGGVKLLYPLSDKRFEFGLSGVFERIDNSLLEFIDQALLELILFTPILLLLLLFREYFVTESQVKGDNYL